MFVGYSIELIDHLRGKLGSIVCDYIFLNTEPSNKFFLAENFHPLSCDCRHWFCFDPFGEVVHRYNEELDLADCWWERAEDVNSPDGKRPCEGDGLQVGGPCSRDPRVLFAVIALLHVLKGVLSDCWPAVTCFDDF